VVDLIDAIDRGMNSNQLTGTTPSEIGLLTNLQYLYDETLSLPSFSYERIPLLHFTLSLSLELTRELTHERIDRYVIDLIDVIDRNLGINLLNGTIPSEIGLLTKLTQLYDETSYPPSLSYKGVALIHFTHSLIDM